MIMASFWVEDEDQPLIVRILKDKVGRYEKFNDALPGENGWLSTEYRTLWNGGVEKIISNTIFKCLDLAQPAVINHTGRESATILESCDLPNDVKIHERRGFFDLNEVEQGIKLILNGLVFPLIFLGIIVNKLTHRYIVVHVSEFGCDRDLAKPVFRQLATLELRITI